MVKCYECGKQHNGCMYCSSACKQKAYRKRKAAKRAGGLLGISSMLIDVIGHNDANSAFDHLNQIVGKSNQEQAGAAIAVIVYAIQSKMNHMIAESRN